MLLPEHTCYDRYSLSSNYYERHAFCRKYFWCFSTFRTKNIYTIYLVCYCQSTLATIDIPFRATITNRTRFIDFWCFSTFRTKNIHIYLVCCCQRTIAMIDISFRSIFPFEQELRAARVSSVADSAHLLRSIFLFQPVLRAARAFYRKHLWCFSTCRTKNIHIYLVCFTYIKLSSSKNYKLHSTVLQSCLLLT